MSTPQVTILLPVLNAAATLPETLDSLLTQTFTDFELLVIDDGSTDDTPEILAAAADPRLRVLRNPERLKLAGALNRGLDEARAPLIARMDADDIARPERLARQVDFLAKHPKIALCGSFTRHFGAKEKARETYPVQAEDIRAFSLFNCPFAHPTVMFRAEVFKQHDLRYDGAYYPTEDYELWTRVVHRHPCANHPEVLLDYRVHEKSMTGSDWENMDFQARRLMQNQFAALGVPCTEAQSKINRDIGMARVPCVELPAARDWLAGLLDRNQKTPFCPAVALEQEIRERWFHVCMNARGPGPNRAALYASPEIWKGTKPPLSRTLLLKASILRASVRG
ncbi:MAG: glycosyltransferase [Verrucomicrobia bacterium]|nr:glycosyltransferase [Verrucomicrobiota bacterium]MCH8513404.1 glycosyltransferase [Kiritimatiellia bacterium]